MSTPSNRALPNGSEFCCRTLCPAIRIPKPLLEEAGLGDQVELRVVHGGIMIAAQDGPRAGWAEAAALAKERGDNTLLDDVVPTRFDEVEWKW